ncbi:MAG: NUDIX domain-containing protein [Gemmatimonadota bacterium]
MESIKSSVAVVIRAGSADRQGCILAVRRPPDDPELPDVWGLPAASLRAGESWRAAVERAGRDKLGVELSVAAVLREGAGERPGYRLHMMLCEASIKEGEGEPKVPQRVGGVTQYTEWKWADATELVAGARLGSLCCRLYLREEGETWT